jgi:hypothetical protein
MAHGFNITLLVYGYASIDECGQSVLYNVVLGVLEMRNDLLF